MFVDVGVGLVHASSGKVTSFVTDNFDTTIEPSMVDIILPLQRKQSNRTILVEKYEEHFVLSSCRSIQANSFIVYKQMPDHEGV